MTRSAADKNPLEPFSEVPPRTFETERLRLRALALTDLDLVFDLYTGDPVATKYMAWPRVSTPEEGRPFVEIVDSSFSGKPITHPDFVWLIQLTSTREFIGSCGIGFDSETTAGGGYILNPRFWGKGYAAEAWKVVVDWARGQPNVKRIEATHHPDNPASGAVMRKVGLTFDRINRKENGYPNIDEVVVDELVYAWKRSESE
jgi:ribosomal-protein-alanine N-acetyltransferase